MKMLYRLMVAISLWQPLAGLALSGGDIAYSATGLMSFTSKLMYASFTVIGIFLLTGAYLKYRAYRDNPVETRISTPVVLLLLALLVFGLLAIIAFKDEHVFGPSTPLLVMTTR